MSADTKIKTPKPLLAILFAVLNSIAVVWLWYYIDSCAESYELLFDRFQNNGEDVNFWAPYRWLGLAIILITGGIALADYLINKDSFTLLLSLFFMFYGFLILTDLTKIIFNARITFKSAQGPLDFYVIAIISLSIFTILTKLLTKDVRKRLIEKFKKKPVLHNDILDHFEKEEEE